MEIYLRRRRGRPVLSVIVPTHNRAHGLSRFFGAIERQTLPSSEFEVVAVADGCTDDTVSLLRGLSPSFRLAVVEQNPGRGAAAARNAGAAQAQGEFLLFLDDDMEASPRLLAEHVTALQKEPTSVVLGYFPMQEPGPCDDPFTKASRIWWADGFAERSHPAYRFTLKDLCTGNVSMSRFTFESVGGFDESIDKRGAGEDYEMGYRLLSSGARFRFVRDAASVHHTYTPLPVNLKRAEQEGFGQAMLVSRHPELFWEFNISRLSRIADIWWARPLYKLLWSAPGLASAPVAVLRMWVQFLADRGIHSFLWRFYRPLRGFYYFKGVQLALGSLAAWERLAQDAPLEMPGAVEKEIDLSRDIDRLTEIIDGERVDAVRITCRGVPIGRIAPWAGAEPLTAEQVRVLLIRRYPSYLLSVLTERLFEDAPALQRNSTGGSL